MILLIDNYDSFSYNLFQLVGELEPDIRVVRNDALTLAEIREMDPTGVILSPGPGRPEEAGITMEVAAHLEGDIPLLGVCLGHQAICAAFGGRVTHARHLMHGKQSLVQFDTQSTLFRGCDPKGPVARYHSLAAEESTLPEALRVTARTEEGEVMAVEHRERPIYGVQFHPESILTPQGRHILRNFLEVKKG